MVRRSILTPFRTKKFYLAFFCILLTFVVCLIGSCTPTGQPKGLRSNAADSGGEPEREIAVVGPSGASALLSNQRRVALVIGNFDYPSHPLKNPVNDATDIVDKLKQVGFQVIKLLNADQRQMEDAIRVFGRELKNGGVGLFYYSGHGLQVMGVNYLVPVDAHIEKKTDVKYECVDANRVLAEMDTARNGLNIMLLDACRDNQYTRSFRGNYSGLAQMDAPTGTFIALAASPGSYSVRGNGRNSTFTKALLRNMDSTGMEIEKVMKLTRNEVILQTGNKQVPWQASSLTGDFYFVPGSKAQTTVIKPLASPSSQPTSKLDMDIETAKLRIEQEKAALEKEKQLAELEAERKRLEEEREKIKKQGETGTPKKQTFVPLENSSMLVNDEGIIYDPKTGLEWFVGPDKGTTFYEAKRWVDSLPVGGGGWRLPTSGELQGLFKRKTGTRNMDPAFKTTGWVVFYPRKTFGGAYDFRYGTAGPGGFVGFEFFPFETRVFAVRERN